MEYFCLSLQILFIFGTLFLPTRDTYLSYSNKLHKKYLILSTVVQMVCFIVNIINLFVLKKMIIYFFALQIILAGLITLFFSLTSKRKVLKELENRIVDKKIMDLSSKEIRNILIKEYDQLYFIEDIEKCLSKINNSK